MDEGTALPVDVTSGMNKTDGSIVSILNGTAITGTADGTADPLSQPLPELPQQWGDWVVAWLPVYWVLPVESP